MALGCKQSVYELCGPRTDVTTEYERRYPTDGDIYGRDFFPGTCAGHLLPIGPFFHGLFVGLSRYVS